MKQDEIRKSRLLNLSKLLGGPRPAGRMLQDYCPACDCIDWQLSRQFWESQGPLAFTSGEVPYVITNDGYLAGNAVAVFLAACEEAAANGTLEDEIKVLELGAGSGLFAKQFLDQLLCHESPVAPKVYARLTYFVTDGSEAMIAAISDRGILAEHKNHVKCLTARLPGVTDLLGGQQVNGQFRAVFANYLLDSLPFTILSLNDDEIHELRLRTSIADGVDLTKYTRLDEDAIAAIFQSANGSDLASLADIYPALIIDGRYDPVRRADLPMAETIPAFTSSEDGPRAYLHCHSALACIQEMLTLLRSDGIMLISDYGQADVDKEQRTLEFQHFGGSVAIGLNFEAIGRVFDTGEYSAVTIPNSDTEFLLSRLVSRNAGVKTIEVFRARYSKETWDQLTKPVNDAQELVSGGQIEAARWKYQEALRLQPYNWALLEEIAGFLCYHLEDYENALKIARETLELNHISTGIWNIVGDCFFYTDNLEEAIESYEKALAINPGDVRALLNLAWVAERTEQPAKALELIAKGLALDTNGAFRDALLGKQTQILEQIGTRHNADAIRGLSRVRGHAGLPGLGDG